MRRDFPGFLEENVSSRGLICLALRRRVRAMTRYLLEVVRAVHLERPGVDLGGARVEIGGRRRFELEMAITVNAPNQMGGMALRAGMAHRGRNVADADADAPVTRAVGAGLMDAQCVVQRELSGRQAAVDGMCDVARVVDPLLGVVDARLHAIGVPDLAVPVAAGNELHAATADR